MKHKILIAFFSLITLAANAQLTINLVVNARPSARLSDWATTKGTVTLIVSNISPQGNRQVKIKSVLKTSDGTIVASTDLNRAPIISIRDGNSVYDANTVFPLEIQQFEGSFQKILSRTGKLSSGAYQLCVEFVNPTTFAPITPTQCRSFFVAALQLPITMMPYDKQELDSRKAQTAIIFRWTPLTPLPQGGVNYRLQVFEILENQQDVQALRANQPLLDKNIFAVTQFIWQPQLSFINSDESDSSDLQKPRRFIWSIQALDASLNPIGNDANYEGRSEPKVFTVNANIKKGSNGKANKKE
ncbi:MAG: hypothetical protein LH615_03480 [Ferruginibacter sp.]|nr:hypothetical protein [Ferruginibacter sp.]